MPKLHARSETGQVFSSCLQPQDCCLFCSAVKKAVDSVFSRFTSLLFIDSFSHFFFFCRCLFLVISNTQGFSSSSDCLWSCCLVSVLIDLFLNRVSGQTSRLSVLATSCFKGRIENSKKSARIISTFTEPRKTSFSFFFSPSFFAEM